jgi:putative transposase
MYLAGVSVRRVEDITEALWGHAREPLNGVQPQQKDPRQHRGLGGCGRSRASAPYLYLDGIVLERSWAGEVRNVSPWVATSVNSEGYREILGICEGGKEDGASWLAFLKQLKQRGLACR